MDLENLAVDEEDIVSFELGSFSIEALLFQSGYLTIVRELEGEDGHRVIYQLSYPNLEIQRRFNKGFIQHLTGNGQMAEYTGRKLLQHLGENDFSAMQGRFRPCFPAFPMNGIKAAVLPVTNPGTRACCIRVSIPWKLQLRRGQFKPWPLGHGGGA